MIRTFIGSPGGGKTYGALKDMRDELLYGHRLCITNMPVHVDRLNAHLQKYDQEAAPDLNQRLRIISDDDAKEFYRFRGVAGIHPKVDRAQSLAGNHVNYTESSCAYYIDEAHIMFDAREWTQTGPELTFYTSQHRKLDDDCVFITQHPDQLEKRVRMLSQEFWIFNNFGMEKFATYFQKPSWFSCEVHRRIPTGLNPIPAQAVYRYKLDKELADCYDTSAGVGIVGRKTHEKKPKESFSIYWLAVPLVVAAFALYQAPELLTRVVNSALSGTAKDATAKIEEKSPPAQTGGALSPSTPIPSTPATPDIPSRPLYVKSYAIRNGEAIVTLSDGQILTKETGLVRITKSMAYMKDGTKYPIMRGNLKSLVEPRSGS